MGKFSNYTKDILAQMSDTPLEYEMNIKFNLIDIITKQMVTLGITQKDLADGIGMKPSRLNKILSAEENVTIKTMAKLFAYFKIRPKFVIETRCF